MKFLEKAFLPVKNKETQVPPWPPEEKKREKKQRQSFALRFTPIEKLDLNAFKDFFFLNFQFNY